MSLIVNFYGFLEIFCFDFIIRRYKKYWIMAKIEMAFSLEINDFVDAIEANELWMEGILKDKREFICVGENCSVRITCKNMADFTSKTYTLKAFLYDFPIVFLTFSDEFYPKSCYFYQVEKMGGFV